MKACILRSTGVVSLDDTPVPKLKAGDILVRFEAGGICGTDLEKIKGGYGPRGILGHEVSGVIENVGDGVKDIHPGDRVVPHHHVSCGTCYLCKHGDPTMCDTFKTTNFDPCGFAEEFRVPEYNVTRGAVLPLPKGLSHEEGALIEPTACCVRALRTAKAAPKESVLVVGLGPTGLTQVQILHHLRAGKIIGSDTIETRRDMAVKMGADLAMDPVKEDVPKAAKRETATGVDLAVVATGNPKALAQAIASVRKGGRVLLFGAPAIGASFDLDVSSLFSRQLSIITSYSCVEADMHEAITLASAGSIDLRALISHRFALTEAVRAFEFAALPSSAVKTIIHS
jgi:L-iditol 2-dehydrogenase